jgi:hypothetical protein
MFVTETLKSDTGISNQREGITRGSVLSGGQLLQIVYTIYHTSVLWYSIDKNL